MPDIKHVGRVKSTGRKCLVAFRTLPGDPYSALIIPTENLPREQHDALMSLVESAASQTSYEFADVLARSIFPDGTTMLPSLHLQQKLVKISTSEIEMTPNTRAVISLDQLNQIIADQSGSSLEDLAVKPSRQQTQGVEVQEVATVKDITPKVEQNVVEDITPTSESPLSDEDIARRMRSDADRLYKEAARLRAEAEQLSPTKKKIKETT
jgi:hypothetical protein